MVTGRIAEDSDRDPIEVDGGMIDSVREFPYQETVSTYTYL